MKNILPKSDFIAFTLLLFFPCFVQAQIGCPDCVSDIPAGFSDDTIHIGTIPDGQVGVYYEEDFSYRFPKTTNPIHELDPSVPKGLSIDKFTIEKVLNIPTGLSWEADRLEINPGDNTDGCIRFCGDPLEPGLFEIALVFTTKVLILSSTDTIFREIYIAPKVSNNQGFTMVNSQGCGEVTVSFMNNIPSNGVNGFSYLWDFGNGITSLDENPADQTYSEPGVYPVSYNASVDTTGYILTSVEVLDVGCGDLIGAPDIYIKINDPDGNEILEMPDFMNTNPPVIFNTSLKLGNGNYTLRVIDEDSGLEGSDDLCGEIPFNQLSNDTLTSGDLVVALTIIHPVETITTADTVYVFEIPDTPVTTIIQGSDVLCKGEFAVLASSYPEGNQWYKNEEPLGIFEDTLLVSETGGYSVEYTSPEGCRAISDELEITVNDKPAKPFIFQSDNVLKLQADVVLPEDFSLQWLLNGEPIEEATFSHLCIEETGDYTLVVTDNETGCTNSFTLTNIQFDPDVSCVTGTEESIWAGNLAVFPNPSGGIFTISQAPAGSDLYIHDYLGRLLVNRRVSGGEVQIDLSHLPSGMYLLNLQNEGRRTFRKLIKK